jgi:hypothetical protein
MKKRRLTPQTRKMIQDAVNAEFTAAGLGRLDEAANILTKAGIDDLPKILEAGILLGFQKQLVYEPSKEELASALSGIKNKLRFELRSTFTDTFVRMKKRLPRRRGGGRKEVLTSEQKVEACDEILSLVGKKVPLKIAFERVARRFTVRLGHNVSARSVKRAWQGRSGESD